MITTIIQISSKSLKEPHIPRQPGPHFGNSCIIVTSVHISGPKLSEGGQGEKNLFHLYIPSGRTVPGIKLTLNKYLMNLNQWNINELLAERDRERERGKEGGRSPI